MNLPARLPLSFRLGSVLAALVLAAPQACPAKPALPDWLKTAMAQPLGDFGKDADAVQIVDTMNIAYTADGTRVSETRMAYRIQNGDGARFASINLSYFKNSSKLLELKAWLVLPEGEIREYKQKDFSNVESSSSGALFTEIWTRSLSLRDSVRPGCVFAWVYREKEKSVFADMTWTTRTDCAILASELTITVPPGWKVRSVPVNQPKAEEQFDGRTYVCLSRRQPCVKEENLVLTDTTNSYFGISVVPSEADRAKCKMLSFDNWNDVARYKASVNNPQAAPDEAIRAKVAALTADCTTLEERIRVLTEYAQSVNYVSVNKNLSKGGGYKPNTAASVFAHNYGDCKDKTALLRAMLSCIGVESYSVSCNLDTDERVNPEFPSTSNFNHCVTALRVPEDFDSAAIVNHPDMGRLVLFDPTDSFTPLGFISLELTNTYFLVGGEGCSHLAKFPDTGNGWKQVTQATIDPWGVLSGTLVEIKEGTAADDERRLFRSGSSEQYGRAVTEWLRSKTRDTQVTDWTHEDDAAKNRFALTVHFDAPGYARHIGASKFLFKAFLAYSGHFNPTQSQQGERKNPILVPRTNLVEDSTITLAEGLEVDEIPPDIALEEKFGTLKFSARAEGNTIHVHLETQTKPVLLPPEDYGKLREFFKARDKALQATLVVRKAAAK